jgi:hypothetical protein
MTINTELEMDLFYLTFLVTLPVASINAKN